MEIEDRVFLVVDDDEMICNLLQEFFHIWCAKKIVIAENRQRAEDKINNEVVDFVITDNDMPSSNDGLELIKAIRANPDIGINSLPIILMSGKLDDDLIQVAISAGANDTVAKPFKLIELKKMIDKL